MKEKNTYNFLIKITAYTNAYVTSDSPGKAAKFLNNVDPEEILQLANSAEIEVGWDAPKILDCEEYALGNIAEEYIIADTEDYEDYDE